ncbi:MAG: hypothetical protein QXP70_05775 [Methanomassiliicoccales archaeon]
MRNLNNTLGAEIRKSRIISPVDGRGVVIAIDHGILMGPVRGLEDIEETVGQIVKGKPDALQCTPPVANAIRENFLGRGAPALIARIDTSNVWRSKPEPKEGYREMLFSVEEAIRAGADAVVVYMLFGYQEDREEGRNIAEIADVISRCQEYSMPCMVEPIGIAKGYQTVRDAELIPLACRIAFETGADILKVDYTGNRETFSKAVDAANVPVLIRGGPKTETVLEAYKMVKEALDAGAKGVVFGRNVWQSPEPAKAVMSYMRLVHDGISPEEAAKIQSRS